MDINENELEDVRNDEKISLDLNESNNNVCGIKEINKFNVLEMESSQSDGSKTVECREDRIKRLKEQSEMERQRKLAEIVESQKQSQELRQKQQIERRKKIEELKLRDEERRKAVEQRRRELDEKEKEKTESLQKRNQEREARAALCAKPSSRPSSTSGGLMSQSLISPRSQARMSTSIHSSGGTSSGSEKCTARQPSDMMSAASNLIVVPDPAPHRHRHRHRHRRLQGPTTPQTRGATVPEGYVEIEPGKFIPASTRHIGCFLPYRGPAYRVRGVLAWAPPPAIRRSGSEAWWAPMGSPERRRNRRNRDQVRARSAHGDSRAESIHNDYDCARTRKDVQSSRAGKVRSTSRGNPTTGVMSTSAIVLHKTSAPAMQSLRPARTAPDDSLFDRLSKPRSGSQPPKTPTGTSTATGINLGKAMTSSSTVLSKPGTARHVISSETATDRISKPTKKPSSTSTVSKTATSPGTVVVTGNNTTVVNDSEPTEVTPSSTADDSPSNSKPTASKANNKNLTRSPADNPDVSSASLVSGEEINYKLKLAEQRRIAREKKEEQLEEQRRIEEEARQRAADEKRRMEEETRQLIEEEAKRSRLLEEERLAELETQRQLEEAERKKKEDADRELEEKRLEKLRIAEEARLDRKRRLEKIMSRVKRPDESSSPSNEECTGVSEPASDGLVNTDDKNELSVHELSLDENRESAKSLDGDSSKETSPQPTKLAWQYGEGDSNASDGSARRADAVHEAACSQATLRNNSPELLSDTVLNLPTPQFHGNNIGTVVESAVDTVPEAAHDSHINPVDPPLRFKSRLLQSMLGNTGRLSSSKDRLDDRDKRHSAYLESSSVSGGIGGASATDRASDDYMLPSSDDPVMHHSRSYQADIGTLAGLVDRDRDSPPSPPLQQQQHQMHRLVNGNSAAMNGDEDSLEMESHDDPGPMRIPDRPNGHSEEPIDSCWSPAPPGAVSASTVITTTTTSPSNSSDLEDPPHLGLAATSLASDSNKLELLTEPASTCSQLGAEDSVVRQLAPPLCNRVLELS